ncbi:hypothetical protein GJU40_00360 [Bacillus lacus]|uniref:Swarming motility protein SwrB n=1 Tax=Metabacillus lacus TaxID=1983721 RepID=A0A7X2IVU1_9BACI|nr:hypothetical protein [Metabacillus lacus]MRX70619.1 hypothetical protein [Metabacillus lacus]
MTTIFFFMSFILHAVSIYFIILLFSRYSSLKDLEAAQRRMLEETEQSLAAYLLQIQEENDKFLTSISRPENRTAENPIKNIITDVSENGGYEESDTEYQPLLETAHIQDQLELSASPAQPDLERALELAEKGYSIEEIAKMLKAGKTEIRLLLKFRQN